MNLDIFGGLPRYVRLTVYTQTRRLLTTPYFNYEDRDDIMQDLLLFYLKRFYTIPNVDEALVVHSIKVHAIKLYKRRKHNLVCLTSSLDYDSFNEDFFYQEETSQNYAFNHSYVNEIFSKADNPKIRQALYLIMEGLSIDQISRQLHMSKETIYKFFKKMKNL